MFTKLRKLVIEKYFNRPDVANEIPDEYPPVKPDYEMGTWYQLKNPVIQISYKTSDDQKYYIKNKKGDMIVIGRYVNYAYLRTLSESTSQYDHVPRISCEVFNLNLPPKKGLDYKGKTTYGKPEFLNSYEPVTNPKLSARLDCLIEKDARDKEAARMKVRKELETAALSEKC